MNGQSMVENRWNQIDRYVNGSMSQEEQTAFEQRMRENLGLAEGVHLHRDILAGIEFRFMQDLKQRLILADKPERKINWKTVAIVLGGILVAAAAGAAVYYYLVQ
ncbi:MAG: hypothetical protein ACFB15_21240 [Cyclobacteriaceae bacterium]